MRSSNQCPPAKSCLAAGNREAELARRPDCQITIRRLLCTRLAGGQEKPFRVPHSLVRGRAPRRCGGITCDYSCDCVSSHFPTNSRHSYARRKTSKQSMLRDCVRKKASAGAANIAPPTSQQIAGVE